MNIKKIIILIAFVVVSLFAGNAYACTMYDQNCAEYQDIMPKIYGSTDSGAGYYNTSNSQNGYGSQYNQTNSGQVVANNYAPRPYLPASPIITNGDGTYTEQNSGKTLGNKNTTSNGNSNSSANNSNTNSTASDTPNTDDTSIFGGIFGGKKSIFSNKVNDPQTDQNMKDLVNSKGLALGSNGNVCTSAEQEYLILYKNITGVVLTNTAVRISLPSGIIPTNTSGGSYSERDNTVTFFIGSLAPDATGQILIPTRKSGVVSGVARSEMVYTLPDQNQNMIVAYTFDNENCTGSSLGANAFNSTSRGGNLFGGTLLGWIFLALFVSAFVYLIRFFLIRNKASHGHDDGHGH